MKEYSYFIDSNIFLRTLTGESKEKFEDCCALLKMVKDEKIQAFTSSLVLAEVHWVLSRVYKFPKARVIEGLRSILSLSNLKFTDNFNQHLAIQAHEDYPVKFIDALIASNSQIQAGKMVVVSYDKDFDKLGIKRVEPDKIRG